VAVADHELGHATHGSRAADCSGALQVDIMWQITKRKRAILPGLTLLLGMTLLLGLNACAVGRVVDRATEPQLRPTDGLLAFALDSNCEVGVALCRNADLSECANLGPLDHKHPLQVQQVPAGQYCLMHIDVTTPDSGTGLSDTVDEASVRCFDVEPGRLAYPGHLVYLVKPSQTTYVTVESGWDKRDTFAEQLRAAYPNLARWPVDVATLHDLRKL